MSKRGHLQVAIGFRTLKIGVAVQVSVVPKQRWQSVRGMLERCSAVAVQSRAPFWPFPEALM